jgi:hypothetical protein
MRIDIASSKTLNNILRRALIAAAVTYVIAATVPGIFLHRITSTSAFVVGQDYHYSLMFGAPLRLLVDPGATLDSIKINYGLLFSLTSAGLAKLFRVESLGGWLRLVQICQLLFLICALWAAWMLERRRLLVLVVAVTLTGWLCTMNQSVVAPTSSGLRFLNFALLPLVLAILKNLQGPRLAALAGLFSGLLILWNQETGIASTAALLFFVFVREYAQKSLLLAALAATALAVIVSIAVTSAGIFVILGESTKFLLFLAYLFGHVNGYNGHPLRFEPIAIICALYASSLVIYTCLSVRAGAADVHSFARAAIAVTVVVWFAYYVHNPGLWGLYSIVALLSFTLAPLFVAPRRIVPVFVWLIIIAMNIEYLATLPARFSWSQPNYQGIIMPADAAVYLNEHGNALKEAPKSTIYFSSTPFTMALVSGRTNSLPAFDPFGETWTDKGFADLIDAVERQMPACILVEAAGSPLLATSPPRSAFMQRVRKALPPGYPLRNTSAGWDFYCQPTF